MKLKKSDLILMEEIIMDYMNYIVELDKEDVDQEFIRKVDKLETKLINMNKVN